MLHPKISRLNESSFAKSGFNVLKKIPPVELGLSLRGGGGGSSGGGVGWKLSETPQLSNDDLLVIMHKRRVKSLFVGVRFRSSSSVCNYNSGA